MKKIFTILSLAAAALFTSCSENENSVTPQPLGKVNVSGTAYAEFNYTDDEDYDVVKEVKVLAVLVDQNENLRFIETTTDANGKYAFEFELGNQPVEVYVMLADFEQEVNYGGGFKQTEVFYGENFETSFIAIKGGQYIRNLYYWD